MKKKKTAKVKKSYYKPKKKTAIKLAKKVAKKSYYKPKKKTVAAAAPKKKYKSYYKPKKVREAEAAALALANVKPVGVAQPAVVKEVFDKPKRPVKYLNNKDLLAEVVKSKQLTAKLGRNFMTNELAKMLQLLCARYAKKGNFANYTYNEDMQGYAMVMLVKTWNSFDPAKSSNPFAFFTQCIKNSFIQNLNMEKRQRDIKDATLVDHGLSPSYNYQYEYAGAVDAEPVIENVNVDLPSQPSHNIDLFETADIDDTNVSDSNDY
jgi:hypothetical protein